MTTRGVCRAGLRTVLALGILVGCAPLAFAADTVPDVRGMLQSDAERILAGEGIPRGKVDVVDEAWQMRHAGRVYQAGMVIQQSPPAGEALRAGDVVLLRVAGGPPVVRAPAPAPMPVVPAPVPMPVVPAPRPYPMPAAPPATVAAPARAARPRVEVSVAAMLGLVPAPEGPVGGVLARLPNEMRWDDLDYQADLGSAIRGRAGVRIAVRGADWLELEGGWLASTSDTSRASGVFAFFPGAGGTGGVSNPNTADLEAESDLYNGELNYVGCLGSDGCQTVQWIGGVRFLRFDETVSASNWAAPFPGLAGSPFVRSEVENTYIAAQLGLAYERRLTSRLLLRTRLTGLVGSMTNDIQVDDEAFFGPGAHSSSTDDSRLAFGGELGVGLRFLVTPRIGIDLGYELLILDQVVRAHDGMDFTKSDTGAVQAIRVGDTLVTHLFHLGLTVGF